MAGRPDVRARDIDRALAATALDNAYADGQLTFDEHRLRLDRARVAETLSDLRRLGADLQVDVDLPEPEPRRAPPRGRIFVALGSVVIIAVGLSLFFATRDDGPEVAEVAEVAAASPKPRVSMPLPEGVTPIVARPFVFDTADGLDDFRSRYIERFGSSEVLELSIQVDADNRADVYRVSDGRRMRVFVSGGFEVDASTGILDPAEQPFDWNLVDSNVIAGLIASTPDTVGVPDAIPDWVTIDNGRIIVTAYDADLRGGRVEADFAGVVTRVSTS